MVESHARARRSPAPRRSSLPAPTESYRGIQAKPRDLLIFACNPKGAPLAGLDDEAHDVQACFPKDADVRQKRNLDPEELRGEMLSRRPRAFLFIGHANANLNGQHTLAFTDGRRQLVVVDPDVLARILGGHAPKQGGPLELVVLNGCKSLELARAVHAAGVPHVVAWRTLVHNEAARIFSVAFFEALSTHGCSHSAAFEQAKQRIETVTRPGNVNGMSGCVPRFELRDPEDSTSATRVAVGIPVLLSDPSLASTSLPGVDARSWRASEYVRTRHRGSAIIGVIFAGIAAIAAISIARNHLVLEIASCSKSPRNHLVHTTRNGAVEPSCSADSRLVSAAQDGDFQRVYKFARQGISVDTKDCEGRTALGRASRNGHLEVAGWLIENGASVELPDSKSLDTPLITATYYGHASVVKMLLDSGASTTPQNSKGKTAWDIALAKCLTPNRLLEYATAFPSSICTHFGIEAATTHATGVVTAVASTAAEYLKERARAKAQGYLDHYFAATETADAEPASGVGGPGAASTAEARAVEALEAVTSQLQPQPAEPAEPADAASLASSALAALEPSRVVAGAPGE